MRLFHSITLAPILFRKPRILRHWLLSARLAQVTLLLVIFFVPSFIPSIIDARLEKLYPPIITKKMFGMVHRATLDPRLDSNKKSARIALWTGSGCLIVFLLLIHIPRAIIQTSNLARKRESKADTFADSQPNKSMALYNSALSLAADPQYEATLKAKLRALENRHPKTIEDQSQNDAISNHEKIVQKTIVLERNFNNVAGEIPTKTERTASRNDGIGPDGRYSIKEELGRGGMGIVYRAYDRVLDREVAFKRIPDYLSNDKELIVRFQQEARALARLSHLNIVQIYDFVQDDEQAWIAMEFVEGEELDEIIQNSDASSVKDILRISTQLAEALAYAHDRGVVHRDFKPANVMLTQDGMPKIMDFGVAKLAQSSVYTQQGSILGSPAYMSPEQAAGKGMDARSDIYAFGVTLYKMFSGRLPFEGDVTSVIAQTLTRDPTPLPDLDY
jgi:predicted Ser/Thr protein kinase